MTGQPTQDSVGRTLREEVSTALDSDPPRAWWLPALRQGAARRSAPRGTGSHDSLTWRLEADPGAPAAARGISLAVLREWGMARFASDAELVVSELVTNALRHGPSSGPGGTVRDPLLQLSLMRRSGELVCAVRDGSDRLPVRREPDFMLETGRGLHLVSCYAAGWGAVPTIPTGKFVWALFS